jgi:excisionase family DNA binding protein
MKTNENQPKRLLDVRSAGEYLGVSAWTVRELCWRGDLRFCQVGRLVRLDIRDLDCFIEASKTQVGVR